MHAGVPRVRCTACGKTSQTPVPWAREGSGFTLMFEALSLSLCKGLPVRQAAQMRRVRVGQFRFGVGWQLVNLFQADGQSAARCLPLRQMDSWGVASLLEQRLVDFWLGGLLEFAQLLPQPFNSLRSTRLGLTQSLMCVPICRWTLQLFAHRNHPLRQAAALTPEQFRRYSSPALPVGMAPLLMRQLQDNGLATSPSPLRTYAWSDWHGAAADGNSLSYGGPHDGLVAAADGVKPLVYPLQIVEVGARCWATAT